MNEEKLKELLKLAWDAGSEECLDTYYGRDTETFQEWYTKQKLGIPAIVSKRNLEEDTVAVSETERGCLMCGLKYIPASDSEKGGEKSVVGEACYCPFPKTDTGGKCTKCNGYPIFERA